MCVCLLPARKLCVCMIERECVCVCVCLLPARKLCVCVIERVCVCVCVCVCVSIMTSPPDADTLSSTTLSGLPEHLSISDQSSISILFAFLSVVLLTLLFAYCCVDGLDVIDLQLFVPSSVSCLEPDCQSLSSLVHSL